MKRVRILVFVSLLISMSVIFTRFLSFENSIMRIGLGFLPIALASALFGPYVGGIAGALADITGMLIFPKGTYFVGFTISGFLSGAIYGFFLYKRPKSLIRIGIAVLLVILVVDQGLNTFWLTILINKSAAVLFLPRLLKNAFMLPVQIITIHLAWKYIGKVLENNYSDN